MTACNKNLKQTQNEARFNPKPTPRSKRDKTKVYHKKGRHLQKQNKLVSLGDEASMRVNTLNMPRKAH
jgi:hypothetical protein